MMSFRKVSWSTYAWSLGFILVGVSPLFWYWWQSVVHGLLPYFPLGGVSGMGRGFLGVDPDTVKWISLLEEGVSSSSWRVPCFSPVDAVCLGKHALVFWPSGFYWVMVGIYQVLVLGGCETSTALSLSGYLVSPVIFLGFILFFLVALLRFLPSWLSVLTLLSSVWAMEPIAGFSPFFPDHHGVHLAVVVGWVMSFFIWGRYSWLVSGLLLGVSLWLGVLPAILFVGVFGFSLLVYYWVGGRLANINWIFYWGVVACAVSILLWFVDFFPERIGMRLEAVHPLWSISVVSGAYLLGWLCSKISGQRFLWATSSLFVLVLSLIFVGSAPLCAYFSGGAFYRPLLPWMAVFMSGVSELMVGSFWGLLSACYFLPVVLLLSFPWYRKSPILVFFLVFSLLAFGLAGFQSRWTPFASFFSFVAFFLVMGDFVRRKPGFFSIGVASAVPLVTGFLFLGFVSSSVEGKSGGLSGDYRWTLDMATLADRLRAQVGGRSFVVGGSPGDGTLLAYYGRSRSADTIYWEASEGISNMARVYGSKDDAEAIELLKSYDVDYLLFSPGTSLFFYALAMGGEESLAARLSRGEIPSWLQLLNPGATKLLVYRVRYPGEP